VQNTKRSVDKLILNSLPDHTQFVTSVLHRWETRSCWNSVSRRPQREMFDQLLYL